MDRREFLKSTGAIVAMIVVAPEIKSLTAPEKIPKLFRRMIYRFTDRGHEAGFNWQLSEMNIVMTSDTWDCVSRAFAYTSGSPNNKGRWSLLQDRMALPINGHWYPVVIDDMTPETPDQTSGFCSDIYFIVKESE